MRKRESGGCQATAKGRRCCAREKECVARDHMLHSEEACATSATLRCSARDRWGQRGSDEGKSAHLKQRRDAMPALRTERSLSPGIRYGPASLSGFFPELDAEHPAHVPRVGLLLGALPRAATRSAARAAASVGVHAGPPPLFTRTTSFLPRGIFGTHTFAHFAHAAGARIHASPQTRDGCSLFDGGRRSSGAGSAAAAQGGIGRRTMGWILGREAFARLLRVSALGAILPVSLHLPKDETASLICVYVNRCEMRPQKAT